jgi:regulator of PEP synthase PpsR (kinase-PPPase family)
MSPARPAGASRLATYFHVHLVSDSTGETLNAMAKAVTARFDGVIPIEHIYALVRSDKQMERGLAEVASAPGVVLHTIVDRDLRAQLEEGCRALDMPQIGALDPLVGALSRYLGASLSTRVGAQHALDHDYFNRIGALDFAMAHDDGQGTAEQLEGADVVLVGVSRTSKTPTCIYLVSQFRPTGWCRSVETVWMASTPITPRPMWNLTPCGTKQSRHGVLLNAVVGPRST